MVELSPKVFIYFISVLFLENIEVCAKAHGQIWSGRLPETLLRPLRLWLVPSGLRSKMASSSST